MKIIKKATLVICSFLFFLGCQDKNEILDLDTSNNLYGSWIYENTSNPADSNIIIYQFSEQNSLVISYYYFFSGQKDTLHEYWTFQIPYPEVISIEFDTLISNNPFISYSHSDDTLLYFFEEEALSLFAESRSYRQISGNGGVLENSQFYDCSLDEMSQTYIHRSYSFTKDSLHYYLTINDTLEYPSEWEDHFRYSYAKTDKYLYIEGNNRVMWKGYKFVGSRLFLSIGPIKLHRE